MGPEKKKAERDLNLLIMIVYIFTNKVKLFVHLKGINLSHPIIFLSKYYYFGYCRVIYFQDQ